MSATGCERERESGPLYYRGFLPASCRYCCHLCCAVLWDSHISPHHEGPLTYRDGLCVGEFIVILGVIWGQEGALVLRGMRGVTEGWRFESTHTYRHRFIRGVYVGFFVFFWGGGHPQGCPVMFSCCVWSGHEQSPAIPFCSLSRLQGLTVR